MKSTPNDPMFKNKLCFGDEALLNEDPDDLSTGRVFPLDPRGGELGIGEMRKEERLCQVICR